MSKLNFSFPIVLDIQATRARHASRMRNVEGSLLFLDGYTDDDLSEAVYHRSLSEFLFIRRQELEGQKLVKAIKQEVNAVIRRSIIDHLKTNSMPLRWDTAYYLAHQEAIDQKMEAVSRILYNEFT